MAERLRILITNDDGIDAPGLLALKCALADMGEVFVVAPERPRSATGHAVTLHKPLRLVECLLADGSPAWSSNGMPTDCVTLGLDVTMAGRADLAVVGVNDGANLGWDLTYSGTVMAALEAAVLGLPAIAISVASDNGSAGDFGPAARLARDLAGRIVADGLERFALLNVNVPDCPAEQIGGVEVTRQGRREYAERIVTRSDPRGRPYYWLSGSLRDDETETDTDIAAIKRRSVSVTPITIDMTAYRLMDGLRAWWPDGPQARR